MKQPKLIEVFCSRQVRVVHRHPDIHMVNKYTEGRPHLAENHEHAVQITVFASCINAQRFVDLLELQSMLEEFVAPRVLHFGAASFEQMCGLVYNHFKPEHRIVRVIIGADGVEGAVLNWEIDE